MPIKSKAQWGFLFAKHPEMARRWAHETPTSYKKLPEKKTESKPSETRAKAAAVVFSGEQAPEELIPGVILKKAADTDLGSLVNLGRLLMVGSLATGVGTGLGAGLAHVTSPSVASMENLRKEELTSAYSRAVEEVKARIAARKARMQNI